MKNVLVMVAVAGLSAAASADFNTGIQAGPFNSDGGAGAAANGVYNFTYTGSSAATYNSIRIRGTATSGGVGSWLSELRWQFVGPTTISSGGLASGNTWSGGQAIDNTQAVSSFSMTNGTSYSFRFWESFDDSGIDATWSNVQFDFGGPLPPPVATNVGTYTAGAFDINTFTSSFDTEIGLYDSTGALMATNDDAGGGLQSQVTPTLANGTYFIALGGYNSTFGNGWTASGGNASGSLNVAINGFTVVGNHAQNAGEIYWLSFNVVPTPGSLSLIGLAGLAGLRRRR